MKYIALVRFHWQPEQRCVGRIRGESADGNRVGRLEAVVLYDDGGARLARVVLSPGENPDVTAPHSSLLSLKPASETASMNA